MGKKKINDFDLENLKAHPYVFYGSNTVGLKYKIDIVNGYLFIKSATPSNYDTIVGTIALDAMEG